MQSHFLASEAWAKWQQSLGHTTFHVKNQDFEYLAILEANRLNKRLYLPYSPLIKRSQSVEKALSSIEELARQQGAWFVRMEPIGEVAASDLKQHGYHKVKSLQPELTWVLDLSPSEAELLANMKQSNRNLHRNGHKKGLKFELATDDKAIDNLTKLMSATAQHNQVNLRSANHVRRQAKLLIADQAARIGQVLLDGKVIASALVYDSPTTRYYAFAASDYEHRRLGAGTYLVSHLILDAKQQEMGEFDFYGITDSEDPKHPWYGFTKFKKSFGGKEKRYLGTWEKPIKKIPYAIYRAGLSLYRKLR